MFAGFAFTQQVGWDRDGVLLCLGCGDSRGGELGPVRVGELLGCDVPASEWGCSDCASHLLGRAGELVGYRSVVDSSVLLCESCYWDICDDRCKPDHGELLRGDAMAILEGVRVCACCRELICS